MKTYNIYMPPQATAGSNISAAIYLPDDKSWFAVLLPPFWLLWNRMWWGFVIYLAYTTIIFLLLLTPWRYAVTFLSALPGLYLFLEAHNLACQQYERKGWWQIGVVHAADVEEAELRFVTSQQSPRNVLQSADPVSSPKSAQLRKSNTGNPAGTRTKSTDSQSTGLFPLDGTV
ncbi:MAG: hypothetical protein GY742_10385 [Hyphomicrobiales bacterium]|nr:hypothetical protein [Hyphomicrobiales bacterium]